jgi:2-polyprenyl-3-methyl-5-hydroxy-6-metoxy-1,4-benzoquinol methylase
MEKISWTDRVRNEEVLHRVKEERNILRTIKRKVNCTGHILHRNCLLKNMMQGKVKVKERRGIRRKAIP